MSRITEDDKKVMTVTLPLTSFEAKLELVEKEGFSRGLREAQDDIMAYILNFLRPERIASAGQLPKYGLGSKENEAVMVELLHHMRGPGGSFR
jgi:hypothetical protein